MNFMHGGPNVLALICIFYLMMRGVKEGVTSITYYVIMQILILINAAFVCYFAMRGRI